MLYRTEDEKVIKKIITTIDKMVAVFKNTIDAGPNITVKEGRILTAYNTDGFPRYVSGKYNVLKEDKPTEIDKFFTENYFSINIEEWLEFRKNKKDIPEFIEIDDDNNFSANTVLNRKLYFKIDHLEDMVEKYLYYEGMTEPIEVIDTTVIDDFSTLIKSSEMVKVVSNGDTYEVIGYYDEPTIENVITNMEISKKYLIGISSKTSDIKWKTYKHNRHGFVQSTLLNVSTYNGLFEVDQIIIMIRLSKN